MNFRDLYFFIVLTLMSTMVFADVAEVTNQQLKALKEEGAVLIDIRRPDEWRKSGIIEGSKLLTFFDARGKYDVKSFLSSLKELVPDGQSFVLICEVGGRSSSVAKLLDRKLGMESVHNLTRGIRHWIKKDGVVVALGE